MRRVPGARWRVLARRWNRESRQYGNSFEAGSVVGVVCDPWRETVSTPDMEFDELVVDRWLHVEQMDTGVWWMNVGGVVLHVRVDREGRPVAVLVEVERQDGVVYGGEVA